MNKAICAVIAAILLLVSITTKAQERVLFYEYNKMVVGKDTALFSSFIRVVDNQLELFRMQGKFVLSSYAYKKKDIQGIIIPIPAGLRTVKIARISGSCPDTVLACDGLKILTRKVPLLQRPFLPDCDFIKEQFDLYKDSAVQKLYYKEKHEVIIKYLK